jgi:hypothetical protein
MFNIFESLYRPEYFPPVVIVDAVITFHQVLLGRQVISGKRKILAQLIVIAFIGIDLFEFLLIFESVVEGEQIMKIPFGSQRQYIKAGAITGRRIPFGIFYQLLHRLRELRKAALDHEKQAD